MQLDILFFVTKLHGIEKYKILRWNGIFIQREQNKESAIKFGKIIVTANETVSTI